MKKCDKCGREEELGFITKFSIPTSTTGEYVNYYYICSSCLGELNGWFAEEQQAVTEEDSSGK